MHIIYSGVGVPPTFILSYLFFIISSLMYKDFMVSHSYKG